MSGLLCLKCFAELWSLLFDDGGCGRKGISTAMDREYKGIRVVVKSDCVIHWETNICCDISYIAAVKRTIFCESNSAVKVTIINVSMLDTQHLVNSLHEKCTYRTTFIAQDRFIKLDSNLSTMN